MLFRSAQWGLGLGFSSSSTSMYAIMISTHTILIFGEYLLGNVVGDVGIFMLQLGDVSVMMPHLCWVWGIFRTDLFCISDV